MDAMPVIQELHFRAKKKGTSGILSIRKCGANYTGAVLPYRLQMVPRYSPLKKSYLASPQITVSMLSIEQAIVGSKYGHTRLLGYYCSILVHLVLKQRSEHGPHGLLSKISQSQVVSDKAGI